MEPKVTGLSPMTGPPGTKITVRGECLGQSSNDIIELTINGANCLPYLDWHSSKKITTRCTKVFGSGDVLITTRSGGQGTCDVQFNCYEEVVGPTDESAVWVDDIDHQAPEKENFNIASTTDEYSIEISSPRFKPHLFLIRNHSEANLDDLKRLRLVLKAKLDSRDDSESIKSESNRAALLKSSLPKIMECLQILGRLNKIIANSRDISIDSIVKSIMDTSSKTHELFDPLLKQNNIVQSIESAMQVFRRKDDTFFDLPRAIETSIQSKNYDSIVKEISTVMSRLKIINMDAELRDRIEKDVAKRSEKLKQTITEQLHESCRSTTGERNIEEVKKLINHLNKLDETTSFEVWIALEEIYDSLIKTLSSEFKKYLKLSLEEAEKLADDKNVNMDIFNQREDPPPVVKFIQSAISIFQGSYYDILSLGQSYFDPKDEFACREEFVNDRHSIFNEMMISTPINHLCSLLRLAIISNLNEKIDKTTYWPDYENQKDMYINWLRYSLNKRWLRIIIHSVIACKIQLTKANMPQSSNMALDEFNKFIVELRRQLMELLFKNAALANKNLHHQEDWITEVDDQYGCVTKLPQVFESNVIDVLKFAKEAILKKSQPDEVSILNNVAVQAEMKELAYGLINAFHTSLDNALSSSEEHQAESTLVLIATKGSTRVPTQLSNRLLITICNYHYTKMRIFPRLKDEFKTLLELSVEKVFEECSKKYRDYIDKTMRRFCAIKCKELTSDYPSASKQDNSNSNPDLQINLMIANSQIFLIAPQLVDELMPEIINKTLEVKNRVKL